MALSDDLTAIFSSGDFDVAAVFTTATTPAVVTVNARGFFTDATEQTDILNSQVETVDPSFTCKAADVSTVKRGHTVVINAVTYTVEKTQRIGAGTTLINLKTT